MSSSYIYIFSWSLWKKYQSKIEILIKNMDNWLQQSYLSIDNIFLIQLFYQNFDNHTHFLYLHNPEQFGMNYINYNIIFIVYFIEYKIKSSMQITVLKLSNIFI